METLSELIGNSVGELVLPFLVEAVSFYSSSFHQVLTAGTFGLKLRRTFYFTEASIIICLSADIIRKMRWFRYWLGEKDRVKLIDENVISSLLTDLNENKVGISAARMFTLDYKLVGKLASLSVMFFIVHLQSEKVQL